MNHQSENHNIPEDLQYREEYAHEGIRALRLARRRRLFWRMSAAMAVLLGIVAVWNSREGSPASDMKTLLVSSTPAQNASEPKNGFSPSTFEGISKPGNEHPLGLKKKTFGQGGSVSSGAESPGRKSTSVSSTIASLPLKDDVLSGDQNHTMAHEIQGMEQMEHAGIQTHPLLPLEMDRRVNLPCAAGVSKLDLTSSSQLSMEAGVIVTKGFGTVQDLVHPDYSVRLVYGKPLNHRSQLLVSMGMVRISGIDRPVEITQRTYSTGLQERKLTYSTDALYFAEFNALYSRSISPGWRVAAGPSAMVLIQGVNHIEEVQSSTVDLPVSHVVESKGFVKGFRPLGLGLNAQVEHALSERTSFGVEASFGLTDMTKVGVFTQENVDRNGYIGCHLRRRLF